MKYAIFPTSWGFMGVMASEKGIRKVVLPQPTRRRVRELLGQGEEGELEDLPQRLQSYFLGERVEFPDPIDGEGCSAFQRQVWEVLRLIPFGQTRTYGWVAQQLNRPGAGRAVGRALATNPIPIVVPCHRVVGKGSLGGFSDGVELKRRLLELEARTSSAPMPPAPPGPNPGEK